MEKPSNIKIFAPTSLEAFDATAEPTLEGQNGTDINSVAIASTEQCINPMDGHPNQQLTIDDDTESATYRIDTALNKLKAYGFAMLDMFNALESTPLTIRRFVQHYFHTADAFGAAVEAIPNAVFSGLLGKRRSAQQYDGISSVTTVANSSQLDYGTDPFALEYYGTLAGFVNRGSVLNVIAGRGSLGIATGYGLALTTGEIPHFFVNAKGIEADLAVSLNTDVHIMGTRDENGLMVLYIDGVAQINTDTETTTVDSADAFLIGKDSNANRHNEQAAKVVRLWNRAPSAAEVLTQSQDPFKIPTVDEDGSTTEIVTNGDFSAWTADNPDNWAVGAESGTEEITEVGPGEGHGGAGAGRCNIYSEGVFIGIGQQVFTVGEKYAIKIVPDTHINGGLTVSAADGGTGAGATVLGTITDASTFYVEYLATQTFLVIGRQAGGANDDLTLESVSVKKIGVVGDWSHDGISPDQGMWFDGSGKALHGTNTSVIYENAPDTNNPGFFLTTFDEVRKLFAFTEFNDDGVIAVEDTLIGLLAYGEIFEFSNLKSGGYAGNIKYGVLSRVSDTGRNMTEELHGAKPSWTLGFSKLTPALWEDFKRFLAVINPSDDISLYPFYISFNYDEADPVFHRVRTFGPLQWGYSDAELRDWMPVLNIVTDL